MFAMTFQKIHPKLAVLPIKLWTKCHFGVFCNMRTLKTPDFGSDSMVLWGKVVFLGVFYENGCFRRCKMAVFCGKESEIG